MMLVFYVFHIFSPVVASIKVLGQVLFTLYVLIEYTEYMSWCFRCWDRKSYTHPMYSTNLHFHFWLNVL